MPHYSAIATQSYKALGYLVDGVQLIVRCTMSGALTCVADDGTNGTVSEVMWIIIHK